MRIRLLAALALAASLGACSTTATSPPRVTLPSPSPTALPDAWNTHADPGQGFSVAIPGTWAVVTRDAPSFEADVMEVSAQSPELGQYFTDSFAKHDQLRLLAADPAGLQQGFATNVNVMISDLGASVTAPTLDEVAGAKVKRLSQTAGLGKPLMQHRDQLSAVEAVRFDYTIGAAASVVRVRSLLATIERGGRRYLVELTMGGAPASADVVFTAEQRLFRLFNPLKAAPSPSAPSSPSASPGGGPGSSA